jgi:hypothetical protein
MLTRSLALCISFGGVRDRNEERKKMIREAGGEMEGYGQGGRTGKGGGKKGEGEEYTQCSSSC